MAAAKVHLEQSVDVREDKGRIIIEPIRPAKLDLNDLVAQITDENRYDEIDFGSPIGKETF